ncbi:hypothetical protein Tsubulata_010164 [Turnera subulata]|uniref:BRISC and BRCA1-A complex member 2 n=1 Tax=Turnera subulata TaxID=218843 RepID=A0A9Q0JK36_9ROSI|nr:hypothetical protein Tsubulata_010164 [Turnera subulata]
MSLDRFPPLISAQLHYLLAHYPDIIKVEHTWSGSKYNSGIHDRFTLLIPYCLDYLKWDVLYNVDSPLAPPDVIFGPDDEDFHPLLGLDGVGDLVLEKSSLCDWNNQDPRRLLALIVELRKKYMAYQRNRVGAVDDDRLKFEISTFGSREVIFRTQFERMLNIPLSCNASYNISLKTPVTLLQGIEMHMSSGFEKPEEVKFAVPLLDMNINKMVLACPWRYPQKIYLQVVYPVTRKYGSAPSAPRLKLMSTPDLKELFSIEDVKLPPWVDGMCMAEYLPPLEELLQRQVVEAVTSIDARRCFIEALVPWFGRPLEADSVFCRKVSFLAASGVFTFLVHFFLGTQFPKQQPVLILQSTQHFNMHGTPVKSTPLSEYPWSPRWEASQMAERMYDFLADESHNFKKYCSEYHLQQ